MKKILVATMVAGWLFLTLTGPVLAADFELRVLENLRQVQPTVVGAAPVPQPVIVDRPAQDLKPAQDLSIFDQFGVFQAPRRDR